MKVLINVMLVLLAVSCAANLGLGLWAHNATSIFVAASNAGTFALLWVVRS